VELKRIDKLKKYCPKCGTKMRIIKGRPICPYCTNIKEALSWEYPEDRLRNR